MHDEDLAVGAVEPGEDQQVIPGLDAVQRVEDVLVEDEPGVGRPLVALLRGGREVAKGRGDPPDDAELAGPGYGRVSQSMIGRATRSSAPVKTPPRKRSPSTGPGTPSA